MAKRKSKGKRKKPQCKVGFSCGFGCIGKNKTCRSNLDKKKNKIVEDYTQFLRRTDPRSALERQFQTSADPTGQQLADELSRRLKNDRAGLLASLDQQILDQETADMDFTREFMDRAEEIKKENKDLSKSLKKRVKKLKDEKEVKDLLETDPIEASKKMIGMHDQAVEDLKKSAEEFRKKLPKKQREINSLERAFKKDLEPEPKKEAPKDKDGLVDMDAIKKENKKIVDKSKSRVKKFREDSDRMEKELKELEDFINETKRILGMEDDKD